MKQESKFWAADGHVISEIVATRSRLIVDAYPSVRSSHFKQVGEPIPHIGLGLPGYVGTNAKAAYIAPDFQLTGDPRSNSKILFHD